MVLDYSPFRTINKNCRAFQSQGINKRKSYKNPLRPYRQEGIFAFLVKLCRESGSFRISLRLILTYYKYLIHFNCRRVINVTRFYCHTDKEV